MTDGFEVPVYDPGAQAPYYPPGGYPNTGYPNSGYPSGTYPGQPYPGVTNAAPGYPAVSYPPPGFPAPPPGGYQPVIAGEGSITARTGWTITAIVLFWPLGIAAYLSSVKVIPAMMMGDYVTAERESNKVKRYGVISIAIVVALIAIWVIGIITLVAIAASSCNNEGAC